MRADKGLILACALAAGFFCAAVYNDMPTAQAQVSRPNPSATAQADKGVAGLPKPSPFPTCVAGKAFQFADTNGCIYACAGAKMVVVARPLTNTCAVPTTGATATPTATITATP